MIYLGGCERTCEEDGTETKFFERCQKSSGYCRVAAPNTSIEKRERVEGEKRCNRRRDTATEQSQRRGRFPQCAQKLAFDIGVGFLLSRTHVLKPLVNPSLMHVGVRELPRGRLAATETGLSRIGVGKNGVLGHARPMPPAFSMWRAAPRRFVTRAARTR